MLMLQTRIIRINANYADEIFLFEFYGADSIYR